jgi:hypothetical protein
MRNLVENATLALLEYCKRENWRGYDPYDALNSRLLKALQLTRIRFCRLAFTQGMKHLPVNLRPILLIPKSENPKACALFCSSLHRLLGCGILKDDSILKSRLERLFELRSKGYPHLCWGYNFDWQGRGLLLPKFTPNIICTTFGGNALLDAFERYHSQELLDAALSAGQFLIDGLRVTSIGEELCFSYTPLDRGQVHNANLLGAAYLGRLARLTGKMQFWDFAVKATQFSLQRQREDGSWPYGEGKNQQWVDNFHTGYNLVALFKLNALLNDARVHEATVRGFNFYIKHFFTDDGVPKYYHDRVWPVDIHSAAQSIVTLSELATLHEDASALAAKVCRWALTNMLSKSGHFYYQKTRFYLNRIAYIRWSEAWMLYALSVLLSSGAGIGQPQQ